MIGPASTELRSIQLGRFCQIGFFVGLALWSLLVIQSEATDLPHSNASSAVSTVLRVTSTRLSNLE
jgi:hypothetical protein